MADPMYRQIAEDLRRQIEAGDLAAGAELPTELELREEYGASRNTVRDAIRLLMTRGLVETRPGQGTYVVEKIKPFVTTLAGDAEKGETNVYIDEVRAGGREPRASEPRVEVQTVEGAIARALRLDEGSQVVSRHQQRFIDEKPWSMQTSFYPMSLVQQGATRLLEATNIPEGAVAYLADDCSIKQAGYRDTIAVRAPNEGEMSFFKLPEDGRVSVFEIFRVAFKENGDRLRLTITVCPTDRNRFAINAGNVPPWHDSASDTL